MLLLDCVKDDEAEGDEAEGDEANDDREDEDVEEEPAVASVEKDDAEDSSNTNGLNGTS